MCLVSVLTCVPVRPVQAAKQRCSVRLYEGATHTGPLIEEPMAGGVDELMEDILEVVRRASWCRGLGKIAALAGRRIVEFKEFSPPP